MRLMSACAIAMSAAINAVITPIHTTTISDGVTPLIAPNEKIGYARATRNTPAATIVAAWINALTGGGPSIASGNQTCSGNCPDFPIAPHEMSSAIQVALAPRMERPDFKRQTHTPSYKRRPPHQPQ